MIRPVFIQRGGGGQRGAGFGGRFISLFKKVFQVARPVLIKAGKQLGKAALKSGVNISKDIIAGKSAKESVKQRLHEGASELTDKFEEKVKKMTGGRGRKRTKRVGIKRKSVSSNLVGVKKRRVVKKRGRKKQKILNNLFGSGRRRRGVQKKSVQRKKRSATVTRRRKKDLFTSY